MSGVATTATAGADPKINGFIRSLLPELLPPKLNTGADVGDVDGNADRELPKLNEGAGAAAADAGADSVFDTFAPNMLGAVDDMGGAAAVKLNEGAGAAAADAAADSVVDTFAPNMLGAVDDMGGAAAVKLNAGAGAAVVDAADDSVVATFAPNMLGAVDDMGEPNKVFPLLGLAPKLKFGAAGGTDPEDVPKVNELSPPPNTRDPGAGGGAPNENPVAPIAAGAPNPTAAGTLEALSFA